MTRPLVQTVHEENHCNSAPGMQVGTHAHTHTHTLTHTHTHAHTRTHYSGVTYVLKGEQDEAIVESVFKTQT